MATLLSQVQRFKARTAPLMPHPTHTVAKSASRSLYAGLAPGRALKSLTEASCCWPVASAKTSRSLKMVPAACTQVVRT